MRNSDRDHLQQLLPLLESGTLSRSDAVALLIYLREEAPDGSMLRDVGHTIAHSSRDRGYVFTYVNQFADHIGAFWSLGRGTPTLFEISDLLDELAALVGQLGMSLDLNAASEHRVETALILADLMDGTEVKLNRALATCLLVGRGVTEPYFSISTYSPETFKFPLLLRWDR